VEGVEQPLERLAADGGQHAQGVHAARAGGRKGRCHGWLLLNVVWFVKDAQDAKAAAVPPNGPRGALRTDTLKHKVKICCRKVGEVELGAFDPLEEGEEGSTANELGHTHGGGIGTELAASLAVGDNLLQQASRVPIF
jgi:hypothetical protein